MKKIIATVLIIITLYGCSKDSLKIDMEKKEYSGDGYNVTMEIPSLHDESDFSENFNTEYIILADEILNDFVTEAEKSDITKDSLTLKQKVRFNKNGIVSIIGDCKTYTGGPHGTLSRIAKNIDIKNGCDITFANLFSDKEYINRINSYIEVLAETSPDKFADLWKTPVISENQEFYITPDGIVIFYPPYALSYYSKGFVEIEIPYEEIESYLNPDYSKILY